MSTRQIDLNEVPGIDVVKARLASIDPDLSVSAAGYEFGRMSYVLELSGHEATKMKRRRSSGFGAIS